VSSDTFLKFLPCTRHRTFADIEVRSNVFQVDPVQ